MKRIYLFFVLFILSLVIACSSDDYKKPLISENFTQAIWPLNNFNYWLMSRDTINDTIKIDTSYYVNSDLLYEVTGINKFMMPNFNLNSQTAIFIKDSIYYLKVFSFTDSLNIFHSEYVIPLVVQNKQVSNEFNYSTIYEIISPNDTINYSVNSNSIIIEKNSLEAIGGYVFTQIIKVKNVYTYASSSYNEILNREIWFQPGVGPVKIIDENQNIIYLIQGYQLSDNQTIP